MFMVMIWYTNYLYIDRGIHFDDNDNGMMMIKTISEANEIRVIV